LAGRASTAAVARPLAVLKREALGRLEARHTLVLGTHRVGVVEHDDGVDALAEPPAARAQEGLREREGEKHEEQHPQKEEQEVLDLLPARGPLVGGLQEAQGGEEHPRRLALVDHVDDDGNAGGQGAQEVERVDEWHQDSLLRLAR
jgi:hypothetical protein